MNWKYIKLKKKKKLIFSLEKYLNARNSALHKIVPLNFKF